MVRLIKAGRAMGAMFMKMADLLKENAFFAAEGDVDENRWFHLKNAFYDFYGCDVDENGWFHSRKMHFAFMIFTKLGLLFENDQFSIF